MPNYLFNLEALPAGEYKATIVILADGRKEIAVVTKTQPDFKIPQIQVPFVISHCPITELPPHGDLIDRNAAVEESKKPTILDLTDVPLFLRDLPVIISASEEQSMPLSKKERVRKFGEVFTPQWCVEDMCDMLEKESPDCYQPETTFLDPATGEGVFVLEVLRRKFGNCKTRSDYSAALRSVYAMDIQADNVEITIRNVTDLCREYFTPSKSDLQVISDHVIQCDSLKVMRMMHDPQLGGTS